MAAPSIHRTLTRHFLRRFLENDLISPEADRSQLLAVVGASLFSTTLFITMFMSFPYITVGWTPAGLALSALSDRHFYIALSMTVSALLAVAQWDSLVVDVRDAAILEPLPVRPTTIRRAKLAAVAILGLAAALIVNVMPTLIFPWLLVYTTRLSVAAMLTLIATHAIVTIAAAVWAYVSVIALREILTGLIPSRWLAFVSPLVQGSLIVVLGSALLLIPPSSTRVAQRGFTDWRSASPPMWFLGVYEVMAGDVLLDAPRGRLSPRQTRADAAALAAYQRHRPQFVALARRAGIGSALSVVLMALGYAWNARRYPSAAPARWRRRRWRARSWLAGLRIVPGQTVRAGYSFTLAAIWRSSLHRLTIACAGAAGVAAAVVTLSGIDVQDAATAADLPTAVFAIQPMFYGALLVAFRHAVRVPAELRANWGFRLAWRDRDREFLAGVKLAALVGIVIRSLMLVLTLFWFLLDLPLAIAHATLGFAGALVVLEALFLAYDKVPFTCTYLPSENLKALGIPYVVLFLTGASIFAGMERAALHDSAGAVRTIGPLTAIYVVLRVGALRRMNRLPIDFEEAPATAQQLGLHT